MYRWTFTWSLRTKVGLATRNNSAAQLWHRADISAAADAVVRTWVRSHPARWESASAAGSNGFGEDLRITANAKRAFCLEPRLKSEFEPWIRYRSLPQQRLRVWWSRNPHTRGPIISYFMLSVPTVPLYERAHSVYVTVDTQWHKLSVAVLFSLQYLGKGRGPQTLEHCEARIVLLIQIFAPSFVLECSKATSERELGVFTRFSALRSV